jgi:hypothetical protein
MEVKDWQGRPYSVGSVIYYPAAAGHSLEMVKAVVEEIYYVAGYYGDYRRVDHDTPGAKLRVRVKPLGHSQPWMRCKEMKPVTLMRTENITVPND